MVILEVVTVLSWLALALLTIRDVRNRDRDHVSALAALKIPSAARAIVWVIAAILTIVMWETRWSMEP